MVQGGAEVLELSAKDTKTLYYMPTGGVRRLTLSTIKDLEKASLVQRASSRRPVVALAMAFSLDVCCCWSRLGLRQY